LAEYSDTHCHLYLNSFQDDLPGVIDRARQAGVTRMMVPGIDLETSRAAVELSQKYPEVYAAVGVHPNSALSWTDSSLNELRQLAAQPKVCAVGEIGLDFYRDSAPPELQTEIVLLQLGLAAELGKPVILHSRQSLPVLWALLETWHSQLVDHELPLANRPGILHSFDGASSLAFTAVNRGFFIGFSGPVTFKNASDRQHLATELPVTAMVFETDAPYLTPHPHRGKRNEPAYVALVADKIASLQNRSPVDVLQITNKNADEIFRWRAPA
jgi:TatD DNase family protein